MKITPQEIRNKHFEKANFRGYSTEEVDAFLSNLALEWERIVNESIMLRMQLDMAEKEAAKFREIQMTLIKTLKTAEDTGNMITEQANLQAEKSLQEAASKSEQILTEAYAEADRLKSETNQEVRRMKEGISVEIQELERTCKTLEHYRNTLLVQLKSLANQTLDHVESFDVTIPAYEAMAETSVPAAAVAEESTSEIGSTVESSVETEVNHVAEVVPTELETVVESEEAPLEEVIAPAAELDLPADLPENNPTAIDLPVGELESRETALAENILAQLKSEVDFPSIEEKLPTSDDFTVIEGITPQIHQALVDSGITTFRALSCLPAYKVFEFLHKKGVGDDEMDIHSWTQHAYRLSGGQMVLENNVATVAEEEVKPIIPVRSAQKIGKDMESPVDYEDKTSKIIQSIRSNMLVEVKNNGKSKKEMDAARLEELLKHRKKDQNSGSFFDNL